ncbi:hypothetical protein QAD02_021695 [Eretmocerus hayati]|uniref:Uncharacterized protein n=1 Tax=Eretmocerus hayati TaxID=131215 RepID=A0ACC2PU50_9HYME|nr:hypothetical protein QAD02_021695 [Eretmocerus hayati]
MSVGNRVQLNSNWMTFPEYKDWLDPDKSTMYGASCKLCCKSFTPSNMGICSINSHAEEKEHQERHKNFLAKNSNMTAYIKISKLNDSIQVLKQNKKNCATEERQMQQSQKSTIADYLHKDIVIGSEILYVLATVYFHISLNTSAKFLKSIKFIFTRKAGSEGELAKQLQLGNDKMGYMINYGLGPYFYERTLASVRGSDVLALSFDGSFNQKMQKIQMDIYVKSWDASKNQAVVRYLGLTFLQHCTALDLLRGFHDVTGEIDYACVVNVGIDVPHVNFKFLVEFKKSLEQGEDGGCKIFDCGSCGIHTLRNSYKTGFDKSEWGIAAFLKAKYFPFVHSGPRQEHYSNITGENISTEKFCSTEWAENVKAAQKAQTEIRSLQEYVHAVSNTSSMAATKSDYNFKTPAKHLNDKLLRSKLALLRPLDPILSHS